MADTTPYRAQVAALPVKGKPGNYHQREQEWLSTTEAAFRVDEPGLTEIIKRLDVSPGNA